MCNIFRVQNAKWRNLCEVSLQALALHYRVLEVWEGCESGRLGILATLAFTL